MSNDRTPGAALSRRRFLSLASAAPVALGVAPLAHTENSRQTGVGSNPVPIVPEWRNRQEGMAYRMLGRTGMMISEVVSGGDPVRLNNLRTTEIAIERGLNYLDMASAYGNGECERAYGQIIDSPSKREKVFMTTKVSSFKYVRNQMYRDIFNGLPGEKQSAIRMRANEIRADRGVDKPGYFYLYWPGMDSSVEGSYLSIAMQKDYAHLVEGSRRFKETIVESLNGSLERAGTDYFDILMCPHGADTPEDVQVPEIWETFAELKRSGKVRFLGVSTHCDPAGVLRAAAETNQYDVCMCAYNIGNGGYMDEPIRFAHQEKGMGIIAMKAAMFVATQHESIKPIPQWRIDMVDRIVPGAMKPPMKAYLWALQNPNISAVVSNLWDPTYVEENLSIAGLKVALNAG